MSTTALTTDGRFLVRRKRPNRPSVDNAFASSWCPHSGVRFNYPSGMDYKSIAKTLKACCDHREYANETSSSECQCAGDA